MNGLLQAAVLLLLLCVLAHLYTRLPHLSPSMLPNTGEHKPNSSR